MLLTNPTPTLSLAHPRSFQQTQHLRFSAYGHINSVWVRMAVPNHLNMVVCDETINLCFGNNPIISTVYLPPPPNGESLCTLSHKKYTELSFAVCLGPCTPGPILHYNQSTLLPSRDILILVMHVQGQSLRLVLVIQILVHHSSIKYCIFSTINPVHVIVVTWKSQEIPFTAIFLQLLITRNFHTTLFYHHILVIEICPTVCTLSLTIAALLSCSTYCDKWMFLSEIQTWTCSVVILSFCYSIPAPYLILLYMYTFTWKIQKIQTTVRYNTVTITSSKYIIMVLEKITQFVSFRRNCLNCFLQPKQNYTQATKLLNPQNPRTLTMSSPSSATSISPSEVVALQEFKYPDPTALCLPIEFMSRPGSTDIEAPSVQPLLAPFLECQKCTTCNAGYQPRYRLRRSSLCKCGHSKKSHIPVKQTTNPPAIAKPSTEDLDDPGSSMVIPANTPLSWLCRSDIDQRRAQSDMRSAFDFGLVYRTEPKQVTNLRIYPLSTPNLQQKALQFFRLSASRTSTDSIVPRCGLIFTGLPTPGCKAELIEVLNTLLCITPYSSLLDGDQCITLIEATGPSGDGAYLHTISHPNNGALYFPCRSDINVHSHLAADCWDHSDTNTHQPSYSEFAFHSLGPTIKHGIGPAPPPTQKRPWTVGVQLIPGSIYDPMLSHNVFPIDVMNHVPLYCLFLEAAYVADAAYNLENAVRSALLHLSIPSTQHVQVIVSRVFLVPEERVASAYVLTVQFNQVTSNDLHSNAIKDSLHNYFLSADRNDISPVLIGAHIFYCSASRPAILFLARRIKKKSLLTENLYQPLAVTISTAQKRQTEFILNWLETKNLGITPNLSEKHLEHPLFPILQDLCFPKQIVRVNRHISRFTASDTEIRLKYSVTLRQKLEAKLTQLLQKHERDFVFGSSGFTDNELADLLSQEYKSLRIHGNDQLTADEILQLQEDNYLDSGIDRLASDPATSAPPKFNHG